MGRLLKTTSKKVVRPECIFCEYDYQQKKKLMSRETTINYEYIPPLGTEFYPVCIHCKPLLEYFIAKYPELWE